MALRTKQGLPTALAIVEEIQRRFGSQILLNGREFAKRYQQSYLLSGYAPLDSIIQGFPVGQVSEIVTSPTAGATTLVHHLIAQTQRDRGVCIYINLTESFDVPYSVSVGVDMEKLFLVQETSLERAVEIIQLLIVQTSIPLIILDAPPTAQIPISARKRLSIALHKSEAVVVCLTTIYPHQQIKQYLMGSDASLRILITPASTQQPRYVQSAWYDALITIDKHSQAIKDGQKIIPVVLPEWRWR